MQSKIWRWTYRLSQTHRGNKRYPSCGENVSKVDRGISKPSDTFHNCSSNLQVENGLIYLPAATWCLSHFLPPSVCNNLLLNRIVHQHDIIQLLNIHSTWSSLALTHLKICKDINSWNLTKQFSFCLKEAQLFGSHAFNGTTLNEPKPHGTGLNLTKRA